MPKAIIIRSNSQIEEIEIDDQQIYPTLQKFLNVTSIHATSITHFEPKYRLGLFFDDTFLLTHKPFNPLASKIAQKAKYRDRFDWDFYLAGDCVMVNENEHGIVDLTLHEFNSLCKQLDLITDQEKLQNKKQIDKNWAELMKLFAKSH